MILLFRFAVAKEFTVPPMTVSAFADTEVTTNLVFNGSRHNIKDFVLDFSLSEGSSNSIQVALGRDENRDGLLSFGETDTVYGWRNGRAMVENVKAGHRYEEAVAEMMQTPCHFRIKMRLNSDLTPNVFLAEINAVHVFENFASCVPQWVYRQQWNLMRITRRGAGTPAEWVSCEINYRSFYLTVR